MIKFYEYNYASESACIAHDSHLLVSRRLKPLSESKDQSVADLTVVFSIFLKKRMGAMIHLQNLSTSKLCHFGI